MGDGADFDSDIEFALELDARDPLAALRAEFSIPERDGRPLTYLCGHSLGLMPRAAPARVTAELERWATRAVDAHFGADGGWYAYHERFAEPLAALAGAHADEIVAMNSLTTNLHLMLVSFFRPQGARSKIAIEAGAFPSDRYAVQSQLRFHGLDPDDCLLELERQDGGAELLPSDLDALLGAHSGEVALVLLPGVQFLTGQALDVAAFAAIARRHGANVGFDVAHAIGNVPLSLHDADVDFAVWCSYKYLNAGPGAVGGCFVHRRWHELASIPRFEGWWGHDKNRRFALDARFRPIAGAEAWQLSNPPILAMAPLAASLELFGRAGVEALREKSIALTGYLERSIDHHCGTGVAIVTPREPTARGCQLSLRLGLDSGARASLAERLRADRVVADWREPDILRLAPAPLYNGYRDVYEAAQAIKRALAA